MTHVFDDPTQFKDDVLRGFAAAHPRHVSRVRDASGFVRAGGPMEGKVSLVIGGGSGHYPSYNGVVGPGFADGAVLGDLFASPSSEQVYRIAKAADGGAGVILGFGNYAGDRLNFGEAAERLRAEGIDTRVVWVTDDIASASPEETGLRRGIAGTFTVYRIAGAAAEAGWGVDEVERVMRAANEATFSFGVAFAGCTMPGSNAPLFEVASGQMDFGLGIHGEPGVTEAPWMTSRDLARTLVEKLLAERPVSVSGRVAVLVNGLGATKYEELYGLFGHIVPLLKDAGLTLVAPEVGELVTSLDMAGCSLTITWLDDELEKLWTSPADTPAYRRGDATASTLFTVRRTVTASRAGAETEGGASAASTAAAAVARRCITALRDVVLDHQQELGRIDAVAGDGDHGIGMSRGATAAAAAAEEAEGGVATVLTAAGAAFSDRAGGTSGILWGRLLDRFGSVLGNDADVTAPLVATAARQSAEGLKTFGKAELGDKTMLDALFPFVESFEGRVAAGEPLAEAWKGAALAAVAAAEATEALVPRIGRARPLADRSVGTPDPGAISLALIVTAVGEVLLDGKAPTT